MFFIAQKIKIHILCYNCQHCDVKTSTVTPTFYYFFIIFLTCYISVPSFS